VVTPRGYESETHDQTCGYLPSGTTSPPIDRHTLYWPVRGEQEYEQLFHQSITEQNEKKSQGDESTVGPAVLVVHITFTVHD